MLDKFRNFKKFSGDAQKNDAGGSKKYHMIPKINFYVNVSFVGALRGGLCLFLEHPLESIKTQWQDKHNIKSKYNIIHNIYTEKGIIGFYRGFLPNFIRVTSKNFFRWPMMLFFPRYFEKNINYFSYKIDLKKKFPGLPKILTGLAIANIEIFVICPLDRLKIFFMTTKNKGKNMFKYFYTSHRKNFIRELFRGLESTFWRSNVSWVSFLYLDHKFKRMFKKYRKSENLGFLDLFVISIFVGVGNLLAGKIYN
jgi:hypothetical protein